MLKATRVSDELRRRVFERRMTGERQYQIAHKARLHPSLVSHILNGSISIHYLDPRVLALARVVGVPAERAFSDITSGD